MKLLTQTGLLFSAVSATTATADGHYGAFRQVDWTATMAEAVQTTTIPGTLGLNPMVRSLETTYDGGKVMSGYGWFTGTATTGWLMKLFGEGCGNTAVVAIPSSAYQVMTVTTSSTAANCVTKTTWIWSALNSAETANAINRSTMVVDAAEEWKNGAKKANTAGGDVIYVAVGGLNSNATFGLGVWSMMIWNTTNLGISETTALYGATFTDAANTGANGSNLWQMGQTTSLNAATTAQTGALNLSNQSNCFTSVTMWSEAQKLYTGEGNTVAGGFATSANGCLDFVTDEWNVSGTYVLMAFQATLSITGTGGPAPGALVTAQVPALSLKASATGANQFLYPTAPIDNPSGNLIYSMNFGSLNQVEAVNALNVNATPTAVLACLVLFTAPEQYGKSVMSNHYSDGTNLIKGAANFDTTVANYGSVTRIWAFSMANSAEAQGMWNTTDSHVAFTGMRLGKGMFGMTTLGAAAPATAAATTAYATPSPVWLNATASGVTQIGANAYTRQISSPAGGVAQFKGLTQTTSNDKYVEVNCRMIQPHFGNTAWQDINNSVTTAGTSGFLLTCMTGISNCINDNTSVVGSRSASNSILNTTEHAACLNDPRYLTWRQLSIVLEWDGTVVWYRTDSYYNPASSSLGSSWGPGTVLSSHVDSARDNTTITATDQSKSYVFALADGSGIQLSHITGGSAVAVAPTANTTAGTGANTLTSSVASFTNTSGSKYEQNYCSESKLLLVGETAANTALLAAAITAFSDGYKAEVALKLDYLLAGAQGGWRGACMVYYSTQYISDETNGAVCVAASQTVGGLGTDLASVKLMHLTAADWQTALGTSSASVTPSAKTISDAKYGIVYAPSAAAKYTFTEGYYASATWYQPKHSSTYTDIGRWGKGDFAGSWCFQGSGSTSYFSQAGAGLTLASAATLAAGAMSLGSALLAM